MNKEAKKFLFDSYLDWTKGERACPWSRISAST